MMGSVVVGAVVLLRLLVPFTILRWRFGGVFVCMAADSLDVILFDAFGAPAYGGLDYHTGDKMLDLYYLSFMVYAVSSWSEPLERRTAIVLYLWRLSGIILFELVHMRQLIFFAPNIFENFYVLVVGVRKFAPRYGIKDARGLVVFLLISGVPKLIQEYVMHYLEFPTWPFIKENILRWR